VSSQAGALAAAGITLMISPTPVVMPRPAQRVPSQPRPVITTTQSSRSARTDAQKSSGGFASFLRRLTGRSASPPKTKSKTISIPPSANSQARPVMPVTMERSASADASSALRTRSTRPTLSIETPSTATTMPSTIRPGPLTAPAAPQPSQILPGPTPLSPQQISVTPAAEIQPRPTDPCEIPLPPSPLAAPLSLPTASEPPSELLLSPMTPMSPSALKAPTIRRTHPSGMLSLEGFEEESASDLTDEASESEDMVHDLKPIRIPSNGASARSNASANSAVSPATPASVISAYDEIVTPSSAHGSSPDFHARYAGSSPPRKAPIGTGAGTGDLGRKGSKWRKSVMGLSDVSAADDCVYSADNSISEVKGYLGSSRRGSRRRVTTRTKRISAVSPITGRAARRHFTARPVSRRSCGRSKIRRRATGPRRSSCRDVVDWELMRTGSAETTNTALIPPHWIPWIPCKWADHFFGRTCCYHTFRGELPVVQVRCRMNE